ncbi:uncharacterized protein MONOS_4422 [Monocercomonoides exilis]|uniref:uncharacterized protein n=1 Tax=Monocercomonoides exilis TaxID=2049356 RepID=UPI0035597F63|nr:hypothetical protein MONOS_4422 [Monocercomonoides exilis]|eukprot:MONOS_4422.1-p1 / transcript=MONOS_4422.1 / gene=MONOS_4422 / organism=Monocercomonoides_exilis_PA203 / gene_product=unspecified product / transcript_product=unspecified product / location=Mono_scaffold00117:97060-98399(+) / protein_length=346 / sequence_SO=supercontig / SO=protein_coding / is_pseudo=false
MWECTAQDYADEQDLLLLVVVYRSETIFASSSSDNSSDSRQGSKRLRCLDQVAGCGRRKRDYSAEHQHWKQEEQSRFVLAESENGISHVFFFVRGSKRRTILLIYELEYSDANSVVLLDFRNLVNISTQQVLISSCTLEQSTLILYNCKDSQLQKVQIRNAESKASLIVLSSDGSGGHSNVQYYHSEFDAISVLSGSLLSIECQDSDIQMNFLAISNTILGEGCAGSVASNASAFHLKQSSFQNITRDSLGPCCLAVSSSSFLLELENYSNKKCVSTSEKGSIEALEDLTDVNLSSYSFDGATSAPELRASDDRSEELCQWSGLMVDLQDCSGRISDTTISNSSK